VGSFEKSLEAPYYATLHKGGAQVPDGQQDEEKTQRLREVPSSKIIAFSNFNSGMQQGR